MAEAAFSLAARTFFAQQEGVEAQVVDGQVEPALPWDSAFPGAAGVIVDQLLLLRHPEQPAHLQLRLPELPALLLRLLALLQPLLLRDDALQEVTMLVDARADKTRHRQVDPRRRTQIFPFTKVVTSSSLSKMEMVCSRLDSSQSQCSVISFLDEPVRQKNRVIRETRLTSRTQGH